MKPRAKKKEKSGRLSKPVSLIDLHNALHNPDGEYTPEFIFTHMNAEQITDDICRILVKNFQSQRAFLLKYITIQVKYNAELL